MTRHPLEQAFHDYGTALGEYETASSLAYNLGAELNGRMVDAALKGHPIDAADLVAEMEMCRDAGVKAEKKRVALKAAWAAIGIALANAKKGMRR